MCAKWKSFPEIETVLFVCILSLKSLPCHLFSVISGDERKISNPQRFAKSEIVLGIHTLIYLQTNKVEEHAIILN